MLAGVKIPECSALLLHLAAPLCFCSLSIFHSDRWRTGGSVQNPLALHPQRDGQTRHSDGFLQSSRTTRERWSCVCWSWLSTSCIYMVMTSSEITIEHAFLLLHEQHVQFWNWKLEVLDEDADPSPLSLTEFTPSASVEHKHFTGCFQSSWGNVKNDFI